MTIPSNRKYSDTHEWYLIEGDVVTMGITQFAADELTDITFVDLPEVGATLAPGDVIGEVESVKASSEIYCHVGGEVLEVNRELGEHPELINEDAYEAGWMAKIKVESPKPLTKLMDAREYREHISE